jgi:hypothetical protein
MKSTFIRLGYRVLYCNVKVKVTLQATKSLEGGRGIALLILDLGATRGWVVSTTPRPLYPRERLGTHCTGGWVGPRAWEKSHPTGIRSPYRPARNQSLTDWATSCTKFSVISVSCKNCPSAWCETAVSLICYDAAISYKQIRILQHILRLYFVHLCFMWVTFVSQVICDFFQVINLTFLVDWNVVYVLV